MRLLRKKTIPLLISIIVLLTGCFFNIFVHAFGTESVDKNISAFVLAGDDEISFDTDYLKKSVTVYVNLPARNYQDVSVICLTPDYYENSSLKDGTDWLLYKTSICYLQQITLNEQGQGEFQMEFEETINGNYTLVADSYVRSFNFTDENLSTSSETSNTGTSSVNSTINSSANTSGINSSADSSDSTSGINSSPDPSDNTSGINSSADSSANTSGINSTINSSADSGVNTPVINSSIDSSTNAFSAASDIASGTIQDINASNPKTGSNDIKLSLIAILFSSSVLLIFILRKNHIS